MSLGRMAYPSAITHVGQAMSRRPLIAAGTPTPVDRRKEDQGAQHTEAPAVKAQAAAAHDGTGFVQKPGEGRLRHSETA